MSRSPLPRLSVVTRELTERPDLIALADRRDPLLWVRGERGLVGIGEAVRLTFRGAGRFEEASSMWQELVARATVDDPIAQPGTGLLALGTFAFADDSAAESVLVVPRIIVGTRDGRAWATTVRDSDGNGRDTDVNSHEDGVTVPERDVPHADTWPGVTFVETRDSVEAYRAGVLEASTRIAQSHVEKIVLARTLTGHVPSDADVRVPLTRLAERYTDCWTFAVDGMLGASPETLIRVIDQSVSARILAGTRKRSDDPDQDAQMRAELHGSTKEQHEHILAVESVIDELVPHIEDLKVDAHPYVLELPNVWHLATDLTAALADGASSIELAGAVHPTAAVAGTPTRDAIAAIREIEPFDRGRYAGAVGWINAAGDGEWAIALRSAQVTREPDGSATITAYAGGGILAGSDPDHELTETVAKFRPITEAFA